MRPGQREPMTDVGLGVVVEKARHIPGNIVEPREHGAAGVDHRPVEQSRPGQALDHGKALLRRHRLGRVRRSGKRQGRVDDDVLDLADAFYDRAIGVEILVLTARGGIVDMEMDDGGAFAGAGDAL